MRWRNFHGLTDEQDDGDQDGPGEVRLGPGRADRCTMATSRCGKSGTRAGDGDMIGVGLFWTAWLDSVKAAGTTMCKTNLILTCPPFGVTTLPIDDFSFHTSPSTRPFSARTLSIPTQGPICRSVRVQHYCFNNRVEALSRRQVDRQRGTSSILRGPKHFHTCHDVESPS